MRTIQGATSELLKAHRQNLDFSILLSKKIYFGAIAPDQKLEPNSVKLSQTQPNSVK